jgi:pentatricopeptide repeat protein
LDISPCDPLRFSSQGRARPTPVIRKALFSTSVSPDEKSERRLELEKLEGQAGDDPLAWNALILGYSELGDAGKAEELLFQMESKAGISSPKVFQSDKPDGMDSLKIDPNALPDIDSYTAVMDAWIEQQTTRPELTRLGIFHAAERAHAILTHMEQIYGLLAKTDAYKNFSISIRPTSHHYDTVIQAWSKSCVGGGFAARGAPQRAQHLLERMEVYGLDSKSGIKPTVETYNHVISAWGESDEHLRGSRAHAVYEKIADGASVLDIKPNHKTHRVMIRSWSRSEQKPAAFKATGHIMKMQEQLEAGVEDMEPKLEDYHMLLEIWTRAP